MRVAKWAGCQIRRMAEVGSTNREAREWALEGAPHGAVVVAARQTQGRGRLQRKWHAPEGGLWLSIVLRPKMEAALFPLLSFAAAVAVREACEAMSGAKARIKWPNDVVITGRKVSGILLEKEGSAAILGIGVNVCQCETHFPEELRERAISLSMAGGRQVSIDAVEKALLLALERRIDAWDFVEEYAEYCVTLRSPVCVSDANGSFSGFAERLDPDGALVVQDEQGVCRRVLAGDVSIRGRDGYV